MHELNCINHCATHDGCINFVRFSEFRWMVLIVQLQMQRILPRFFDYYKRIRCTAARQCPEYFGFCDVFAQRVYHKSNKINHSQRIVCVHWFVSGLFKVHVFVLKQWRTRGDCDLLCGKRFCSDFNQSIVHLTCPLKCDAFHSVRVKSIAGKRTNRITILPCRSEHNRSTNKILSYSPCAPFANIRFWQALHIKINF